jgi:hypothetical protein
MCHPAARPSVAEYWHIGAMAILFFRVMPLIFNGENRVVMSQFFIGEEHKYTK